MGSHSRHGVVMAKPETSEEEDFTYLNQMPSLLFDDYDFSFYSGLDCEFDFPLQESWSYLPDLYGVISNDPFSSWSFDWLLPDPLEEMWCSYGSGFDDFGQETSWFELFDSFCNGENGHGGGDKCVEEEEKKGNDEICRTDEGRMGNNEICRKEEEKVIFRSSSKPSELSREVISKYFYLPITQAAKELNVGLTRLKKRCRELGIERWPHRKLASLETLINNVKEMAGEGLAAKNREAIEKLEELEMEKKLVENVPNKELATSTRRLRQHCFKDRYKKKRRLMTDMAMPSYESSSSASTNQSSTFTNVSGFDTSCGDHQRDMSN